MMYVSHGCQVAPRKIMVNEKKSSHLHEVYGECCDACLKACKGGTCLASQCKIGRGGRIVLSRSAWDIVISMVVQGNTVRNAPED